MDRWLYLQAWELAVPCPFPQPWAGLADLSSDPWFSEDQSCPASSSMKLWMPLAEPGLVLQPILG